MCCQLCGLMPDFQGCRWVQGLPRNGHPETVAVYAVLLTTMGSLISWAVSLTAATCCTCMQLCVLDRTT